MTKVLRSMPAALLPYIIFELDHADRFANRFVGIGTSSNGRPVWS